MCKPPAWFAAASAVMVLGLVSVTVSLLVAITMPALLCIVFFAVLILARHSEQGTPYPWNGIREAFSRAYGLVGFTALVCTLLEAVGVTFVSAAALKPQLYDLLPMARSLFAGALPDRATVEVGLHEVNTLSGLTMIVIIMVAGCFDTPLRFLLRQWVDDRELSERLWLRALVLNSAVQRLVSAVALIAVMMLTGLGFRIDLVWLTTTYCLLIGPAWVYVVFRMMFTGQRELPADDRARAHARPVTAALERRLARQAR